jgi:ATP-binding cassette subfamily B protein
VDLLAGLLTLLGMVGVMLAFNWQFTLLSIFVVPTLFLIVWSYTGRIKAATKKAAQAAGQLADIATEDVRAITEVKAFTLEERETLHLKTYVDTYRDAGLRAARLEAEFRPLVTLVLILSTFTIVGVGSYVATGHPFRLGFLVIPGGTLTIGTLTVFLAYIRQLYQPMRDVSKLMYIATNAAAGADRIQEVLEQPPEVVEAPTVIGPLSPIRGSLTYDRVVFGYVPSRPVIKGVRLHVEAGQRLALVGLSGSGKTTLVKLIPRFYEPWRGEVRIDGVDNRRYPLAVLRQNVGFVLQDSVLFEGTIRDNIAIGRPEATDRQIVAAARQAQIHDTISSLPGRYAAHVREQGKNLSSGQRQRLAIARAILRDAPILVLDEPTANLDVEAEAEVMRALDKLVGGRTVIMISHRLSTLGHAHEIAVLHKGALVERGDFGTLKKAGGMFSRLLAEQTRYSSDGATQQSRYVAPARDGSSRRPRPPARGSQ